MTGMNSSCNSSLLLVISAPSGGGKTTVCQKLLEANSNLLRAVTCTTRPARPGETAGKDYFFLSSEEFEQRRKAGDFLEHATVFGYEYGTLKSEVLDKLKSGCDVLLNVDVQGAASIRRQTASDPTLKNAIVTVFLTPEKLSILEQRLYRRGQDSPEVIKKRLAVAREEIRRWNEFDFLVISTSIDEDFRRMQTIFESEKMRQFRCNPPEGSTT